MVASFPVAVASGDPMRRTPRCGRPARRCSRALKADQQPEFVDVFAGKEIRLAL